MWICNTAFQVGLGPLLLCLFTLLTLQLVFGTYMITDLTIKSIKSSDFSQYDGRYHFMKFAFLAKSVLSDHKTMNTLGFSNDKQYFNSGADIRVTYSSSRAP